MLFAWPVNQYRFEVLTHSHFYASHVSMVYRRSKSTYRRSASLGPPAFGLGLAAFHANVVELVECCHVSPQVRQR